MSDAPRLKKNAKLISECATLLEEHNKLSYKEIFLITPTVEFNSIKPKGRSPKDPVSLSIISFYETYTSQMITIAMLKKIINDIAYTNEDLSLHIDRSQDSIIRIFSSLTKNRIEISNRHMTIIENLEEETKSFIDQTVSIIRDDTNIDEVISVIFICMEQAGLPIPIGYDPTERPFILVGSRLLAAFNESKQLATPQINVIRKLNSKLKQSILGAADKTESQLSINQLQRFGLVPDDMDNTSLKHAIDDLFGLNVQDIESIENVIEPITKTLKLVGADTGLPTGLIIVLSSNYDSYFNMKSLYSITKPFGSSGINNDMISKLDLIKHKSDPIVKSSSILTINVNDRETKMAYVLWTNDFKTFKYKKNPIYEDIIQNMLARSPSSIIEAYNANFEASIANARSDDDAVSFNRVRYMSFNESVTEESFLVHFRDKLIAALMRSIGKLTGNKLTSAIVDNSFDLDVLDIIDALKLDIGIHPSLLPSHCHIIYASMAIKIVSKTKKILITHSSITKDLLKEVIGSIVMTNDNIYSRTISGYYLHIA